MGIRLVYGLQTGDESYLDIFHPSRRLKEAALAAGLDYAAMIHCPSDPPSRILKFCSGRQENHVALLRGELPDSLFRYLESEGIRVINPASAVALVRDKLGSAQFFDSIGTEHPRTILQQEVPSPRHLVPPLPLPFVAKPRFGKMGRGVVLIESMDQWSRYIAEATEKNQETLVQEFMGAAMGQDIRFFFANFSTGSKTGSEAGSSSPRDWVCVMRRAPGFLSNAHAGGSMEAFAPPEELQCEARRIFAASGLVYGTVDFLFAGEDGRGFVVCELNANPGFEELERAMKIDVATAILSSAILASANTGTEGTP